jgi:hypothetical protein
MQVHRDGFDAGQNRLPEPLQGRLRARRGVALDHLLDDAAGGITH